LPGTAYGTSKLKLVHVVFRHGARTPLTDKFWEGQVWDCCGEPYKEARVEIHTKGGGPQPVSGKNDEQVSTVLAGGCHKGELTILGKIQARELGKWLRQRYCADLGFLPASYQEGSISAHTTNMARTVQTLTGVVSGLYSDMPADRPLQVTTAADHDEFMYANPKACPAVKPLLLASRKLALADAESKQAMDEVTKQVVERSGGALQPPFHIIDMYDAYTATLSHGKALPEWMDATLLGKIEELATQRIKQIFGSDSPDDSSELLHMVMGRLLQEIVGNMDACIAGESKEKLHLYSGHDTTVVPLLAAFGMNLDHWPPYASNIVIELWECMSHGKAEYYVRAMYNGNVVSWPGLLPGEMCRLDHLKEYILHRFLEHNPLQDCHTWDKEAQAAAEVTGGGAGTQF